MICAITFHYFTLMVKLNKKMIINLSVFILIFAAIKYFMYADGWLDLFITQYGTDNIYLI